MAQQQFRDIVFTGRVTNLLPIPVQVGKIQYNDVTPDISGSHCWQFMNSQHTLVTSFTGGQDGDTITLVGDGYTTLKHDTNYFIFDDGFDRFLELNKVYTLIKIEGVWREPCTRTSKGFFDVTQYGVIGDGITDNTAKLIILLAFVGMLGGILYFPPGVYLISAALTLPRGVSIVGANKEVCIIKAKDGAYFQDMFVGYNCFGVTFAHITLDVNRAGRPDVPAHRTVLEAVRLVRAHDFWVNDILVKNGRGYHDGVKPVHGAVFSLAETKGARLAHLTIRHCGDAILGPSDGFYGSGDQIQLTDFEAEGTTDHACVLENCNYSGVNGFSIINCIASVAVSNAVNVDKVGNYILNGTVTGWSGAVTGGLFLGVFSSGNLLNTLVANVIMTRTDGLGPALQLWNTGTGKIRHVDLNNIEIYGAELQGVLINAEYVRARGLTIVGTGATPFQTLPGCKEISFKGGSIVTSYPFAMYIDGTQGFTAGGSIDILGINGTMNYGIYCDHSCTDVAIDWSVVVKNANTAPIFMDGPSKSTQPIIVPQNTVPPFPRNGDMWRVDNELFLHSGGVTRKLTFT